MLAFPPREARGLTRPLALVLEAALLLLTACTARDGPHARAVRLDRERGTSAFVWLVNHEPSRLEVSGIDPALVAPFDADATVRSAGDDLRRACRVAKRDRALLLAFVPRASPERSTALDCGFALERDPAAVIVAPR